MDSEDDDLFEDDDPPFPEPMNGEEESAYLERIRGFFDERVLSMLDKPLREFNNQTPREIASTAKGRKQIGQWITMLEDQFKTIGDQFGALNYSANWIFKELGIKDTRQASLFE